MIVFEDHTDVLLLKISAEFTIEHAEAHRRVLIEACGKKKSIHVDAGHISVIDITGLQLLQALKNAIIQLPASLRWNAKSNALLKAAEVGGFDSLFQESEHHDA